MSVTAAIRLVKSLSSSEKRFFRLQTRQQAGNNDYILLFDVIDKSKTTAAEDITRRFSELSKTSAIDNTARYLVKLLTDCLVASKIEKDPSFGMLHGIMRTRVLKERALEEEAGKELLKIRNQAKQSQQHLIEYITYRQQLDHCIQNNFNGINDRQLVELQMKAKDNIKSLHHIHDHHSLFELLKYRLIRSGKILANENRKELNDLMLSEMILVAGKSKNSFAANKLHLLFQSFFFTDIGDYKSASKTFNSLNKLFEENIELLDNPPTDYLAALDGILDSLCTISKFEETEFYLDKAAVLDQSIYPEYFRFQVRKTVFIYRLRLLIENKLVTEAAGYIGATGKELISSYSMVDEEKQLELYFYCSLVFFHKKNWKKADACLAEALANHRPGTKLLISKAIRLLNMIIYYEKKDAEYLKYEVRSYKRFFGQRQNLLKSEILLLKFLNNDVSRKKLPEQQAKKLLKEIASVKSDQYERQLLKYFDFTTWISSKI